MLLWGHMCWLWSPGHPSNTSGYSLFPSFQHVAPGLPTLPGLKTVLNLGGGAQFPCGASGREPPLPMQETIEMRVQSLG